MHLNWYLVFCRTRVLELRTLHSFESMFSFIISNVIASMSRNSLINGLWCVRAMLCTRVNILCRYNFRPENSVSWNWKIIVAVYPWGIFSDCIFLNQGFSTIIFNLKVYTEGTPTHWWWKPWSDDHMWLEAERLETLLHRETRVTFISLVSYFVWTRIIIIISSHSEPERPPNVAWNLTKRK